MEIEVRVYTKELVQDVLDFEARLRKEEDFWGWEIDEKYIDSVKKSFDDPAFDHSLSLLAYVDDKVVGRIDSSIIASHFDGSKKAYLDWICVIKSYRHSGVPLRYNKDKRKNPVFSRVSAFVVAYSIPFPTLIVNEKSVE